MNHKKNNQKIIHQKLALDTYFSAMLDDIPKEQSIEKGSSVIVDTDRMVSCKKMDINFSNDLTFN
ncbi:MAG: hypothetical protein L3J59_02720 [Methylococcaceae bacterium]|nr:hypothetical protein [Methylococcaceae bacterium]